MGRPTSLSTPTSGHTTANVNLHAEPLTASAPIALLAVNTAITYYPDTLSVIPDAKGNRFVWIETPGYEGYVASQYVEADPPAPPVEPEPPVPDPPLASPFLTDDELRQLIDLFAQASITMDNLRQFWQDKYDRRTNP